MDKKKKGQKIKETTKSIFQEWWEYSALEENDTTTRILYKILVRILGIILIIIFSPAIAIVLFVAFIAVI